MKNQLLKKQPLVTASLKSEIRSSKMEESLRNYQPEHVIKEEVNSCVGIPFEYSDNDSHDKEDVLEFETALINLEFS